MLRNEEIGGLEKITLPPRFAVDEAAEFRKLAYALLEKGKKVLITDFSHCQFIDSTGLGVLVSVYKKFTEQGGSLKLCCINDSNVLKIFQLTRLDKVFSIYDSFSDVNQ